MTKSVTEQVARQKEQMALRLGKSKETAKKWGDDVRAYDAREKTKGNR